MRANTCTAWMRAARATPERGAPARVLRPAAMPATWVPWSQPSIVA